jgi:hypothetical protein
LNKNGHLLKEEFKIGSDIIESVKHCKYLGIVFTNTGNFGEARKILYEKGLKASFKLIQGLKVCLIIYTKLAAYIRSYNQANSIIWS